MWSSVNNRDSLWERMTGRPEGWENGRAGAASYRRMIDDECPSVGRPRKLKKNGEPKKLKNRPLTAAEERARIKAAKNVEKQIKETQRKVAALSKQRKGLAKQHDDLVTQANRHAAAGDRGMARRALDTAKRKAREIARIDAELRGLG